MFAIVIQAKHTKMSKSKRAKTHKKVVEVVEDSSDSKESTGSSNENHQMDIDDNVKKTKTDKETMYRKAIENLGAVTEIK